MRRNVNKLATLVMTGMLAASMSFSAFATTVPGDTEESGAPAETAGATKELEIKDKNEAAVSVGPVITINKDVTTDGMTMAPNTEFAITVGTGRIAGNYKDPNGKTYYGVVAGDTTGVETTTAKFSPKDKDGNPVTLSDKYTSQFTIDFSKVTFNNAGVYSYTVTEADSKYDGIKYDTTTKDLLVFVVNKAYNKGLEVKNIILVDTDKNDTDKKVKINTITNLYGTDTTKDSVHDLTISKEIKGSGANLSGAFTFNVNVEGADGEMYKVYVVDGEKKSEEYLTSKTSADFTVHNNTTIQICGLSENDKVTVKEAEAGKDGYTTTYTTTYAATETNKTSGSLDMLNESTNDDAVTVKVSKDKATLKITNEKDFVTPTGVAMDVAPYALMVALAGGAAVTFLRKKESFED